jgi:hypothetical protein
MKFTTRRHRPARLLTAIHAQRATAHPARVPRACGRRADFGQGYHWLQRAEAVIPPLGAALPNTKIFRRLAAHFGFDEPCTMPRTRS